METTPVSSGGNILVICTGNVCRSPFLEFVLRHELGHAGFTVSSAGTHALIDRPADPGTLRLLGARGIDASDFRARQVTAAMVREADLIIAASREHVGAVAQVSPLALRKGFALADLSKMLEGVPDSEVLHWPGVSRAQSIAQGAIARRGEVNPSTQLEATIYDPYGQDAAAFDRMEREIMRPLPAVIKALLA